MHKKINTSTLAKRHWMIKLRKMRWIGRREVPKAGAFKGGGGRLLGCGRSPQMVIKKHKHTHAHTNL